MIVTPYKTKKIFEGDELFSVLRDFLPKNLPDHSVVAVSSKIIAICEGRVADPKEISRDELAMQESDYYLPRETNPYNVMITIKNNTFIASAGIDQSNGNGKYVLWPKDLQQSANSIREFLLSRTDLGSIGVIVTDSRLSPLRWGVTGVALSHSGFIAINSYIGKEDLFGRKLRVETVNVADTLAAAAVGVMGEGAEQTPLAVVSDIPWVQFVDHNPTSEELNMLHVDMNKEVFTPIVTSVKWKKGGESK